MLRRSYASCKGAGAVGRRVVLAAVVVLLGLCSSTASADPFGGGPWYQADSIIHSYCYGAGFNAGLEDEADFAMKTSLDRDTVMSDGFSACQATATDVQWFDANLPGATRGQYLCVNLSGEICNASRVTLDPAQINQGSNDAEDRKKTACHEVGHSVGLEHGDFKTDCMKNGEIQNTSAQWRTFSNHHIFDHINPTYG